MSPPLPPSETSDLVVDGLKAASLGGAAMLARGLLSSDKLSWGWIARSALAAAIISALAGMGLRDFVESESLRYACIGLCGFAAPEICDAAIRWVKAKGDSHVKDAGGK